MTDAPSPTHHPALAHGLMKMEPEEQGNSFPGSLCLVGCWEEGRFTQTWGRVEWAEGQTKLGSPRNRSVFPDLPSSSHWLPALFLHSLLLILVITSWANIPQHYKYTWHFRNPNRSLFMLSLYECTIQKALARAVPDRGSLCEPRNPQHCCNWWIRWTQDAVEFQRDSVWDS